MGLSVDATYGYSIRNLRFLATIQFCFSSHETPLLAPFDDTCYKSGNRSSYNLGGENPLCGEHGSCGELKEPTAFIESEPIAWLCIDLVSGRSSRFVVVA